jgi:hypothetical protein
LIGLYFVFLEVPKSGFSSVGVGFLTAAVMKSCLVGCDGVKKPSDVSEERGTSFLRDLIS